jgi:hypothetical protein
MSNDASIVKTGAAGGTEIAREGFGEKSLERRRETASTAVAAQAQATVQARYIVARQTPRDWSDVRVSLLHECERTSFADRALYALPRGRKQNDAGDWVDNIVEGLTVRFAEAVIRTAGNVLSTTRTVYDDEEKRILNVSVTDLESNAVYERDLVIDKTVERSDAKGRIVLAQRTNSWGKPVYIVVCTEDELSQKEGVQISKTVRTLSLRFLPADITEECVTKIKATRKLTVETDPDAARKAVADAFAGIGVMPSGLKEYMGQDLAALSPAQIEHLRGLFSAIKGGDCTWAEALAERTGEVKADTPAAAQEPKAKVGKSVADRIKKRQEAAAAKKTADAGPPATEVRKDPAPAGYACAICGQPVQNGVSTHLKDGAVGMRHPDCPPFGAQERQPGDD